MENILIDFTYNSFFFFNATLDRIYLILMKLAPGILWVNHFIRTRKTEYRRSEIGFLVLRDKGYTLAKVTHYQT